MVTADDRHASAPQKAGDDSGSQTVASSARSSQRWFWVAVTASIVGVAILFVLFAGLLPGTDDLSSHSEAQSPAAGPDTLVVAVARTPGGPTEWSNWSRVIKALSQELGLPLSVRYLSKEDETAETVTSEDIDIAFVCAHQYLELRERDSVIGLVSPTIDDEHMTVFELIVRDDDPAESWEDLEGSPIATSDKSSLGGYAYLNALSAEHGATPEEHFSEVRLGEAQETNMRDLLEGDVRATVVNSAQVAAWDMSDFKAVERSESLGTPPVVVDAEMDPELVETIREFFLGFDTALLPPESHITGFVELDEADYEYAETLRDACGQHTHP